MIQAIVQPSNATEKRLLWSSSNNAVASVDDNGSVRALAQGRATITATTQDGGKQATFNVTVRSAATVATTAAEPLGDLGGTSSTNQNAYYGTWQGRDSRGQTYSVRFTNSEWESYKTEGGARRPDYRGTYTTNGSQINLLITHQVDLTTMGWMPQRGNLGPNLRGSRTGRSLRIGDLTDAELVKRN